MLLVPRSEKVTTNTIKTSYSSSAGTALVFFDEAVVPEEHIIGKPHGCLSPLPLMLPQGRSTAGWSSSWQTSTMSDG